MLQILATAIISFIVAFLAIPVIILVAEKKKLFDIPDERKLHTHTIASLGGIGVFIGLTFALLLSVNFQQSPEFQYFIAALLLMFFIGLKDDIIALSAFKKFVVQIIAAGLVIHLGGIRIESLYGLAGIYDISPVYGLALSYIILILIINAFNLIDGVDGLAGSLGILSTSLLGTYFYMAGMMPYALLAFSLSAALMAFLIFNFHPAKIFMGDCGSLTVGLICGILVLKFINVAANPASPFPIESSVALGIAVILVPLVDTVRVFAIRIFKGRSPFFPDRNHVHHLLLDHGFNHSGVTTICVAANILFIVWVYFCRSLGNTPLVIGLFFICYVILGALFYTLPRRKLVIQRQIISSLQEKKPASKVIDLSTKKELGNEKVKG